MVTGAPSSWDSANKEGERERAMTLYRRGRDACRRRGTTRRDRPGGRRLAIAARRVPGPAGLGRGVRSGLPQGRDAGARAEADGRHRADEGLGREARGRRVARDGIRVTTEGSGRSKRVAARIAYA